MSRFMLDRQVSTPPGYAERGGLLVSYRLPLLKHCYVLCLDVHSDEQSRRVELMAFFLMEAERLALDAVGDSQAFMLIHSGRSIRRRLSWHLHVFVVQHRWQKALVYGVLGIKNSALAFYSAIRSHFARALLSRGKV